MPEKRGRDNFAQAMRKAAPYLNLGWTFAVSLAGGILAGWWLDGVLGTRPWLLLSGALVGMTAGFVGFFRVALPRKDKPRDDDRGR